MHNFVLQLSALRGVKHKNIVQFYGFNKDPDGGILLLMGINSLKKQVQKY